MEFNEEISEIIDILKSIAISYFYHLKQKERFEQFVVGLGSFLTTVDWEQVMHPFLKVTRSPVTSHPVTQQGNWETGGLVAGGSLVVAITSDEPFVGGLNIRVINRALEVKGEVKGDREKVKGKREDERPLSPITFNLSPSLVVVGEQGKNYLEEMRGPFVYFRGVGEEIEYQQVEQVRDYLLSQYLEKNLERVIIVYPHFISFSHQEVEVFQLLPYKRVKGNGERVKGPSTLNPQPELIIEPSLNRVAGYLIRLWVGRKLYEIFYESKLSELAARAMHLEGSFLELSQIRKNLKLQYIRSLHEAMDKANRDIFASRTLWNG